MRFYAAIERKVEHLLNQGRNVILLGDVGLYRILFINY